MDTHKESSTSPFQPALSKVYYLKIYNVYNISKSEDPNIPNILCTYDYDGISEVYKHLKDFWI